ncbi:kinase-like domain-containing protein [Aspergillus granulosus]|uniref:Kinase-like domain-containing protein n=1 Tax=Aspergillus granulosus TaxID=176169 RepID=A0ABR4I1Y4_9EURO
MASYRRGSDNLIIIIRNELHQAMHRKDDDSKRFVPRDSLDGIWTEPRLREFAQKYECFGEEDIPHIRACLLQTISILVEINWNGWEDFQAIFLDHENRENRTDKHILNYNLQMLRENTFFGDSWAETFLHNRYIFCPVDIEEDMDAEYPPERRLPFLDPAKSLETRRGASGTVTKEFIAVAHLKYKECTASTHRNIMILFAAITTGGEFNLLFEYADMTLEDLLKKPTGSFTLCDLITESCNLAYALEFLHEGMHPRLTVCHKDLKPSNILVVSERPGVGVGIWKISDFGISQLPTPQLDASVESLSLEGGIRPQGLYQPPEANNGSHMGRRSDVWSLGCILVRVLAFGIGGASELEKLDTKLHQLEEGDRYGSFYRGDPPRLKPHVEKWLQELPAHRSARLPLEACNRLRTLLFQMLQIDRTKRLRAKRVHEDLWVINELLRAHLASDLGVPSQPSSIRFEGRISTSWVVDAILEGDMSALKAFLSHDVDIKECAAGHHQEPPLKERPLIHAIQQRSADAVGILLSSREDVDIESPDRGGNTPLYCAIAEGDSKIVEHLLKAKVNVNAPSTGGLTPLMKATMEGHLEIVRTLLDNSADYRAYSDDGFTCVHYIVQAQQAGAELIWEFRRRQISLDIERREHGETLLSTLLRYYNHKEPEEWKKKFDALMTPPVNVNLEDKNGMAPLFHAVSRNLHEPTSKLVELDAKYGSKRLNKDSWCPTDEMRRLMRKNPQLKPLRSRSSWWS